MKLTLKIRITIFSILISATSYSQQDFSQFMPNAQAIAIGGSSVSLAYDPAACYWNPASIAFLTTNQVLVNIDNQSNVSYIGMNRFFPPALSMGINFARLNDEERRRYDMVILAMAYRFLPFLSIGSNFNFSKTMDDEIYSSFGLGLFFKTVPDFQSRFDSRATLWSWLRSKQMYDKFGFGIALHDFSFNENKRKYDLRIASAIKPINMGPLIHFACHFKPDDYSLHLGTIASLSRYLDLYMGVRDLNINNFAAGGATQWGPFAVEMGYDFKSTTVNFSLMLRLSEDKNALFQKYKELGNQQIKDDNYSAALKAYKKARAYNPANEDITYLISVLQKNAVRSSQTIDSLIAAGKSFEAKGWYINAFNSYRKIIELDQHNRKAQKLLKELNPKLTPYLNQIFGQGFAYYLSQDFKKAELIFKQILAVDENHRDAKIYLARVDSINSKTADEYYYRGLGYYKQNNLTRAIQEFKDALTFNPAHKEAKENLDKAENELARNIQLVDKYLKEAKNYEQKEQYVKALLAYRKIIEVDKTHQYARERLTYLDNHISREIDERFRRAKRLYDRAYYADAMALFQEILSIDPDHTASKDHLKLASQKLLDLAQQHYERAQNHFSQKKWDIVLQECDLTLKMNPNHIAAKQLQQMALANISLDKLIDKGLELYQRGEYTNARATFNQVLAKEPNNTAAQNYLIAIEKDIKQKIEMLFNMGMMKYTEGAYEEAIREWRKILEINPDHQSARDYIQKAQDRIDALKRIE